MGIIRVEKSDHFKRNPLSMGKSGIQELAISQPGSEILNSSEIALSVCVVAVQNAVYPILGIAYVVIISCARAYCILSHQINHAQ
jgi:hypothetical protein